MAMQCIMEYSSFRFEWRAASGALLALVHDVVFVLVFCVKPNLIVLAAILTYSFNDSIIEDRMGK
jgi:preprotein translocase subunit SecF